MVMKRRTDVVFKEIIDWGKGNKNSSSYRKSTVNKYEGLQSNGKLSCGICFSCYKMGIISYRRSADRCPSPSDRQSFYILHYLKGAWLFFFERNKMLHIYLSKEFSIPLVLHVLKGVWSARWEALSGMKINNNLWPQTQLSLCPILHNWRFSRNNPGRWKQSHFLKLPRSLELRAKGCSPQT